jgi:DNA-directed RNA polymerase specialized sigma24 family protein
MSVWQEDFESHAPVEAEPPWPLIQRAQQGDRAAFEGIRALLARPVRNVVRAVLPGKPAEWDDVEQELWLSLWLGFGNYRPEMGPLAPYVRRAARLKAFDWLRKRYRDRSVSLDESDGSAPVAEPASPSTPESASEPASSAVYRALALVMLESASKPYQVVACGFADLLSYSVDAIIAEFSGVPVPALAARLEREYLAQAKDDCVAAAFARFREQLHDDATLGAHLGNKPHQDVAHWRESVRRAAQRAVLGAEKEFVAAVFHDLPPDGSFPHESLTFAFIRLLEHNGELFWERESATRLGALADRFRTGYRAKRGLSEAQLRRATAELSEVLARRMNVVFRFHSARLRPACLNQVAAETSLEDYAGDNPRAAIVAWIEAVQARLNRDGRSGAAWLVYAFVSRRMAYAQRVSPGGKHAAQ